MARHLKTLRFIEIAFLIHLEIWRITDNNIHLFQSGIAYILCHEHHIRYMVMLHILFRNRYGLRLDIDAIQI